MPGVRSPSATSPRSGGRERHRKCSRRCSPGFELVEADPRVVSLNLVQPEDDPIAVRDFSLHMSMLDYLHGQYPRVPIALHAGELADGLVPPEALRFHVRDSIRIGHARRIGHGAAVMYEDDPFGLLRELAEKQVLVEVALSSADADSRRQRRAPSAEDVPAVRRAGRARHRRHGRVADRRNPGIPEAVEPSTDSTIRPLKAAGCATRSSTASRTRPPRTRLQADSSARSPPFERRTRTRSRRRDDRQHCHLADETFAGDLADVVARAQGRPSLERPLVILEAGNAKEAAQARAAARRSGRRLASRSASTRIRHTSSRTTPTRAAAIVREQFSRTPAARAVGEIGLDYHYDFSPREVQQAVFRASAAPRAGARPPRRHPHPRGGRRHRCRDSARGRRRPVARRPSLFHRQRTQLADAGARTRLLHLGGRHPDVSQGRGICAR